MQPLAILRIARGLYAIAASGSEPRSDNVLIARVRSKMGRVISHPSSIEVTADQGRITLSGPILAHELNDLLTTIARIPDVVEVENRLEVHNRQGIIQHCKVAQAGSAIASS